MTTLRHKTCANLTIARTRKSTFGDDVVIEARQHGQRVGVILANHVGDPLGLQVAWVNVSAGLRRCGLATRLYTAMAQVACDAGGVLSSDVLRKPTTEAFWRKQVAKSRAVCARAAGQSPHPDYGRGGCETYALTTCPVTTLAAARRRRAGPLMLQSPPYGKHNGQESVRRRGDQRDGRIRTART
ncbi:MAG: hypothetical protein IPJ61_19615 [Tessaracoccus sp.]|uniref:hypothetical protein n=1 Tax=Tessaracoccus sp. TaxID=1971211 RepID=UPI001ED37006|nr:hypothetical protein [Tessaracoccus sp.]MBK7823195.1 hypothetical protein [Tessaracoccus sp.]